jgi:hypothetical protein
MNTPARPPAFLRCQATFVAVAVLAFLAVPMAARAAHRNDPLQLFLAGLHRPVVHLAHVSAHVPHVPHVQAGHARHDVRHVHSPGDDGFRWSLHDGEFRSNCGVSTGELRDVIEALGGRGTFLWISQDGDEWVIRDRALVQRARGSVEPMERLGKEMGRLGEEMGRIGARQGRFGAEMGRLGARQGVLGARLALLQLRDDDDDPAIEREADAIEREMEELSRQQDGFEGRQESLDGGRMDDLGERMGELGDQMEQLAGRAKRELKALVKEAIASRRAERVRGRLGL